MGGNYKSRIEADVTLSILKYIKRTLIRPTKLAFCLYVVNRANCSVFLIYNSLIPFYGSQLVIKKTLIHIHLTQPTRQSYTLLKRQFTQVLTCFNCSRLLLQVGKL
jgi:hypothetical protein